MNGFKKTTGNAMKTKIIFIIFLTAALCLNLSALNLFSGGGKKGVRKGKRKPTEITSEKLNADMKKNTIIFTENVFVDDDQMTISCHKMTIFLEEKDKKFTDDDPKDKKKKSGEKKNEEEELKSSKEPTKVLCEGDVIIVRKVYDADEKEKGAQKAKADKAVYDLKIGKIELTGSRPQITRGEDLVIADKIIIWRDKEAADCLGNVKTILSGALEDDSDEKKKEDETERKLVKEEATQNRMSDEEKKEAEISKLREKTSKRRVERKPVSESDTVEAIMNGAREEEKKEKPKEKSIEDLIKDEVTDKPQK
jgi:lipopolysaccharide export system protein LptA